MKSSSEKRLVLIDVFNYLHRAYHALPKSFKNSKGDPVNAVYGFASMLISTIDTLKPTHIIAAWDEKDKDTFRAAQFTGYKAHRPKLEEDLDSQLPKAQEVLKGFGIPLIYVPGYEADDVIGTIANQAARLSAPGSPLSVIVVTNDQDMLQLVGKNVKVFIPKGGKGQGTFFGPKEVGRKYGFTPRQMIDYKALRGDPSDNIPGVKGIGDKTAKELISKYGSVEKIYKRIREIHPESVRMRLSVDPEIAVLSKDLATIRTNVPISLDLKESKFRQLNKVSATKVLKKYNFKSLVKRFGVDKNNSKEKKAKIKKLAKGQEKLI